MTPKIKALIDRATHPGTPIEEARSCAMIACKLIVADQERDPWYQEIRWDVPKRPPSNWRPKPAPQPAPELPPAPTIEWVPITSKYTSNCFYCGHIIRAGTRCNWAKKQGVAHIDCYEDRQWPKRPL